MKINGKIFDNSIIIFCLDCKQHNIWRNKYKMIIKEVDKI